MGLLQMNKFQSHDDEDDNIDEHQIHKQHFGQSLKDLKSIKLPSYSAQIPLILIELKKMLHTVDGLKQRKIFHFSIKNNTSTHHKIAHLIRDFFDNLPSKLLDDIPCQYFQRIRSFRDVGDVIDSISDPQKSVLLWLLDLLSDTIEHNEENRMSIHTLSKSMAPNMITNKDNIGTIISFLKNGIEWRLSLRQ